MVQVQWHRWITTCLMLITQCYAPRYSTNSDSLDAKDDLYNGDNDVSPGKLNSPFNGSDDFLLTSSDFKGNDSAPEAASSPRADHFNEQNRGFYSAVIPREMSMSRSVQPLSNRSAIGKNEDTVMLRTSGVVKNKNSWTLSSKRKYHSMDRNFVLRQVPEMSSRRNLTKKPYAYHENPKWNLRRGVVKRSNANNLSQNPRGTRKAHEYRTPKMRIAGSRVSNFGQKPSQYCPKLAIAIRTIVQCSKGLEVGSKCSLSCAPGFVIAGKRKSRRCQRRRRKRRKHHENSVPYWTGKQEDFQCVPVCKHLDVPENGERNCEMVNLARGKALRCTTKCKSGYKVVGTTESTCLESGRWSGHPAVCKVASTRQTRKIRFKFREHQRLPCGEVYGLASFRKDGVVFLVAGDKDGGVVKIFRWGEGKFYDTPYQTFSYPSPEVVEVLTAPEGTIWLIVSGGGPVTMYRMLASGRFHRSHTTQLFGVKRTVGDTIGFAELGGEFYRCYGKNRRDTPVIVVHKLQDKRTPGGNVFQRIMRKKLLGEKVHQCSMYTEGDSLYAVATLNGPDGQGRIMVGHLTRNRMKIVDVLSGKRLQRLTDSFGFSIDGGRYMAVSQGLKNGKCLVYKRQWRTRPPEETG